MKRRSFLKRAAFTGLSATLASAIYAFFQGSRRQPVTAQSVNISRGRRSLTMVTTWPKNFPGLGTGAERVARNIGIATDGQIEIKVYAAGELVPAFGSFDAVSEGSADMYHAADYYWQGKSMGFNFFTAVPFGMTAEEISAWIKHDGGQKLWDELAAGFNIKGLIAGNTGPQMGGWFRNPVRSLEDLKGLKFRMPGLGGEVLRRLGVAPQTIAGGEIFTALQSGAIDGAEWVGPWNDLSFGFYKVAKNYYYPGFHEPGPTLTLGVNKGIWESLSPSQQRIFKDVCTAEEQTMMAEFAARNASALEVLRHEHAITPKPFPKDIMRAILKNSEEVVAESGMQNELTRRIYDSYYGARKRYMEWTRIGVQSFIDNRYTSHTG